MEKSKWVEYRRERSLFDVDDSSSFVFQFCRATTSLLIYRFLLLTLFPLKRKLVYVRKFFFSSLFFFIPVAIFGKLFVLAFLCMLSFLIWISDEEIMSFFLYLALYIHALFFFLHFFLNFYYFWKPPLTLYPSSFIARFNPWPFIHKTCSLTICQHRSFVRFQPEYVDPFLKNQRSRSTRQPTKFQQHQGSRRQPTKFRWHRSLYNRKLSDDPTTLNTTREPKSYRKNNNNNNDDDDNIYIYISP